MAIVVVGGHSRNIGKTSVVARLIAAFPERHWTAVKITQYGHSVCSRSGEPCDCAVDDQEHSFAIMDELDRSGDSDTSRFLLAGAARSLWVRTRQGFLAEAMPSLRQKLAGAEDVILESNSILHFIRPDIYLSVLDFGTPDFKASARRYLDRADALIVTEPVSGFEFAPAWDGISPQSLSRKPMFRVRPPQYMNIELVDFVRERLAQCGATVI